jgi:hypothetical protein
MPPRIAEADRHTRNRDHFNRIANLRLNPTIIANAQLVLADACLSIGRSGGSGGERSVVDDGAGRLAPHRFVECGERGGLKTLTRSWVRHRGSAKACDYVVFPHLRCWHPGP